MKRFNVLLKRLFNKRLFFHKGVLIGLDRLADDLLGFLSAKQGLYSGLLVFKLLVDRKEMHDLVEDMRGQLVDRRDAEVGGVGEGDGNDLIVHLAAVDHTHHADGVDADERERIDRLGAEDKHVQWVSVISVGARDKAVVGGVVRRGIQDSVEPEQSRVLIKLVFALASFGNFYDRVKIGGGDLCGIHIVPNVHEFGSFLDDFIFCFVILHNQTRNRRWRPCCRPYSPLPPKLQTRHFFAGRVGRN